MIRRLRLLGPLLAIGLAGCASTVGDSIPAGLGGLPETAPARPAEQAEYPAIHDMPVPRNARMLDEDQQEKLEKDLTRARDRQEGRNPNAKKPKAGASPNP